MKHSHVFLSLMSSLLLTFTTSAHAESPAIHYILDASGSMWGRVDGEVKMQVAKNVMSALLGEMPAGVESGLTVYGHRKKGDCTDIEEIIPTGPTDKSSVLSKISPLIPKGKKPIAESIVITAEHLKSSEGDTTIVLVSDGI